VTDAGGPNSGAPSRALRAGALQIRLERVRALHPPSDPTAWSVVRDWFTSPYWYAPSRLTELLVDPGVACRTDDPPDAYMAESAISTAVRALAAVDIDGVTTTLVDRLVFGEAGSAGAHALAETIRREDGPCVGVEMDSGLLLGASLPAAIAWILAESLRNGFPAEVTHGHRAILRRFVPTEGLSDRAPVAVPLAALLPLPAGLAARSAIVGRLVAVPLPVYPLVAMVLPECSAAMFPTDERLSALVADRSLGDRRGRLEPLGMWASWTVSVRNLATRPLSRPTRSLVGVFARRLAGWRDGVASTRLGRALVRNGVDLGRVWSALRRASNVAANPWLTRANGSLLDQTGVLDVRS